MNLKIASFLASLACLTSIVAPAAAQSGDWPSGPVRIVVGYPAGGPNDLIRCAANPAVQGGVKSADGEAVLVLFGVSWS
ncbi:MAG: hypothetical protein WCP99_16300, partial [Burkholderiales bacterium]